MNDEKKIPSELPESVRSAGEKVYRTWMEGHKDCAQEFCVSGLTMTMKDVYLAGWRDALKPAPPVIVTCTNCCGTGKVKASS